MTAMLVGTALALAALAFVLYPLFREAPAGVLSRRAAAGDRMATAVDALRDIEFDHATGKLSESDYAALKREYTTRAVLAMRSAGPEVPVCPDCGPRPEQDAVFCSECGRSLAG